MRKYIENLELDQTPQKEIAYLKEQLKLACQYLAEGKRKFAPGTTNSDVDVFLDKHKEL